MRQTADVVIIGGGVLGASLLYHLTTKGVSNAVLLEKGNLASGSTGDSAAIERQHYSNEVSIRLVKKSVEMFKNFPDLFDGADVFTNDGLVKSALKVLEPLYRGENALEPERVSEKLHQDSSWMGRGGTLTHAISGIDIALWDILGQATGQPVGRLLGGCYRQRVWPYAPVLMREPDLLAIPDGPGLGVTLNLEAVAKYSGGKELV